MSEMLINSIKMTEISYKNVELRKLPEGFLNKVIHILEINDDWKYLMASIPKDPQSTVFKAKYNNEHMRMIENAKTPERKCAEILLEEWSTSGKRRPTLETLKQVAASAWLFRAADEIAVLLKEEEPRRPNIGPAAGININLSDLLKSSASIKEKIYELMEKCYQSSALSCLTPSEFPKISELLAKSQSKHQLDLESIRLAKHLTQEIMEMIDNNDPSLDLENLPRVFSILNQSLQSYNVPKMSSILVGTSQKISRKINFKSNNEIESKVNVQIQSHLSQVPRPQTTMDSFTKSGLNSVIMKNKNLINFEYTKLLELTNNFSKKYAKPYKRLPGFIGSGGFGEVFVGFHDTYGPLAIKKAKNKNDTSEITSRVLRNELKYLSKFKHENIVPIFGYAKDGPALCIVCEYISGGSLEQKLAAKVLSENKRINIMLGTANGLKYLHKSETINKEMVPESQQLFPDRSEYKKKNFVHGDIKSANILLTSKCQPKLCDFGLAKQYETTHITACPGGTQPYMSPESLQGTITQKLDIYSYGVVILELLTGLKPMISISKRTRITLKHWTRDNGIKNLLDPVVKNWTKADEIYELATKCLAEDRKDRPPIEQVYDILYKMRRSKNL